MGDIVRACKALYPRSGNIIAIGTLAMIVSLTPSSQDGFAARRATFVFDDGHVADVVFWERETSYLFEVLS